MAKEHFRTIAYRETKHWDFDMLAQYHIREAFGLYLFREGEATHICSFTPNSRCDFLSNEFIFEDDATDDARDRAWDALAYEGAQAASGYFGFIDLATVDRRKVSDRITVDLDGRTFAGGLRGEAYLDAIWNEARESVSCNSLEPAILNAATFDAWEAEQVVKRRAENRPPLYGNDQLPLFAAACNRIGLQSRGEAAALGWL